MNTRVGGDPLFTEKTVDLMTAARPLNIGRSLAYRLAAEGNFPVPVLRLGARYRVPTAALRALLGIGAGEASGG